jgi:hypothetical protein
MNWAARSVIAQGRLNPGNFSGVIERGSGPVRVHEPNLPR